jgi:hypothetical protein
MKKIFLLLALALSLSANAQNKKKLFYLLNQQPAGLVDTSDPTYQALLSYADGNGIGI